MQLQIVHRTDASGESVATLVATGFIDLSTREEFVDRGQELLAQEGALRLDLAGVDFMDSTGIGALVDLSKMCERGDQPFTIVAASPQVHRVLEVTGLAGAWVSE